MAEKKQNNELDLEQMDQVSGGAIETRYKLFKGRQYRANNDGYKSDWGSLEDANKANDDYLKNKYNKGNITINQN